VTQGARHVHWTWTAVGIFREKMAQPPRKKLASMPMHLSISPIVWSNIEWNCCVAVLSGAKHWVAVWSAKPLRHNDLRQWWQGTQEACWRCSPWASCHNVDYHRGDVRGHCGHDGVARLTLHLEAHTHTNVHQHNTPCHGLLKTVTGSKKNPRCKQFD